MGPGRGDYFKPAQAEVEEAAAALRVHATDLVGDLQEEARAALEAGTVERADAALRELCSLPDEDMTWAAEIIFEAALRSRAPHA